MADHLARFQPCGTRPPGSLTAQRQCLARCLAPRLLHRLGEGMRRRVWLAQQRPTRSAAGGEKSRSLAQETLVEIVAEGEGDLRVGQGQGGGATPGRDGHGAPAAPPCLFGNPASPRQSSLVNFCALWTVRPAEKT